MKKLMKFSLTALCLATLTACGSGGGSNNSAPSNGNSTGSVTTPNNPTPTPSVPTNNTQVVGANGLTTASIIGSKLIVDGKTLELSPPGFTSSNINVSSGNMELVKSTTNNGVSYGFVSEGRDKDRYAFVTSSAAETSKMPVSGVANYEGKAIFSKGGDASNSIKTFHLAANFGSKEVSGFISGLASGQMLNFIQSSSNIEGNTFSVTAEGYRANEVVSVKGKFYGDVDAVGGTFVSPDNSISGSFGGDVIKSTKRVQY